ncbi:MAG: serine/threonine protein kinase, partial [Cyanobacteria bacterium]|nr:serine/threonine protein kinase [Cyanobacteriota bacterium]
MKLCGECNEHFDDELNYCPSDGVELDDVGFDPLLGQVIGDKYRILCQAGEGSMSVVYKALQESTGREMAVKMLHKFLGGKEDLVKRFFREAKAVSSLHHTNIIKLYDFGIMPDEQPYIVTEYLHGVTLSRLLRERHHMTVSESLPLIEQMCNGIAEAHRNRVIHRDLKPDNIVLQGIDFSKPSNAADLIGMNCVRVVDFGVAKMWGSETASLTIEGKVCGSPAYMSPEQCKGGDIDFRTDIYSIGVVLFEMFTGRRPFMANDLMALMLMHVNKEAPSIAEISPDVTYPPGLSSIVAKCLSKNPEDRFKSVEHLWYEVESVCTFKRQESRSIPIKKNDEWIPFDSPSNQALKRASLERTAPMKHFAQEEEWNYTTTQLPTIHKAKPGSFRFRFGHLKIGIFVTILCVSVFTMVDLFKNMTGTNTAKTLFESGNFEGCIQIMETMHDKKNMTQQDKDLLNLAYIQLAKKRLADAQGKSAISLLDKIDRDSSYYE